MPASVYIIDYYYYLILNLEPEAKTKYSVLLNSLHYTITR